MATDKEKPLLQAYLVTGSDELKRQTVIKRLRERFSREGDLAFNCDTFNAENASGEQIVSACNTLPFASDRRLVEVSSAERLKGADLEAVLSYLAAPASTTVLALVTAGVAKNTRLYKAVAALGAQSVIDCAPVKRSELPARVRAMATSHGITMTPAAANALIDAVGENTVAIDSALEKLALSHAGADPVGDGEVLALIPRTAEAKPWEFVDAFASRNIAKCLMVRKRLDSTSPHALMAMCTTRIRELIAAKSLEERGQGRALASYLKVPDWRVRSHSVWAQAFSSAELRQALASARDAEQAMKSGADPEAAFIDWYISVIS